MPNPPAIPESTGATSRSFNPSSSADPFPKLWVQRRLAELRFLGYVGVQFNAVLVPVMIFQLTHSAAWAGVALAVEWLPKLALYLTGGSAVQRYRAARLHVGLEAARLIALGVLALCALGYGSVWLIALAAAQYQCANAISNIVFELSVTAWWDEPNRATGHATMLLRDQLGCLVALILGLVVGSPLLLAGVAVLWQCGTFLRVWSLAAYVHPQSTTNSGTALTASPRVSLLLQLRQDLRNACTPRLLRFAFSSMLLAVPAALVFSTLAFFLERAHPGSAAQARVLSGLLLARVALSAGVLAWVKRKMAQVPGSEGQLALLGQVLLLTSTLLLAYPLPLLGLATSVLVLGASGYLYMPWLRTQRQELLLRDVPAASRAGVTGVLISVEASAYLLGAALLSMFGSNLAAALIVAAGFVAGGAWALRRARPD